MSTATELRPGEAEHAADARESARVDLPIKGDPEVSRLHATLERDDQGRYWFTPKGRNPTFVGGREIQREERVQVQPDEKIEIAGFTLRIQPK